MSLADVFLIIPILTGTWLGFRNGFILTLTTLLAFTLASYAAIWFSGAVSGWILSMMNSPNEYVPLIAFSICFIAVCALVFFVGKWASRLAKLVLLGSIDKLAGAVFGFIQFTLITAVLMSVVDSYLTRKTGEVPAWREHSLLYEPLSSLSSFVLPGLEEQLQIVYTLEEIRETPDQ